MVKIAKTDSTVRASDRLHLYASDAWGLIFSVPGLPLKRRPKRTILVGGIWFWLIVGSLYLFAYALIFEYALLVVGLRLAVALILTLCWGIAKGVEALQRRYQKPD